MNLSTILQNGLLYGLILSGALLVIMFASMLWNPAIWAGDYPSDIREKFGPLDEKTTRQKRLVGLPFFVALFGVLVLSLVRLRALSGGDLAFVPALLNTFVALSVFNLVDLLIVDWLVFVIIQPKIIVLPGTRGMAGYRNMRFHFVAFLKGVVFMTVASLLIAALASLF